MKTHHLLQKILVTILTLGSVITFSVQASVAMGSKKDIAPIQIAENVREFIDPDLLPPLEQLPAQLSLITRESVVETRALVSQMLKAKEMERVTVTKRQISSTEGEVTVYIYQPEEKRPNSPGMLWIHGGGFIMGDAENDFSGEFSIELNATVVSVEY